MHYISYDIGPDDIITAVGGEWELFALENGAPDLVSVTGCYLWEFIAGLATREVYRELLVRVRRGDEVRFPFRCDGPDIIREMSMMMHPLESGAVRFESFLLATKPRMVRQRMHAVEGLRMCSWCKRVAIGDEWLYPEFAVEALAPFEAAADTAIAHGICPGCAAMLSVSPAR